MTDLITIAISVLVFTMLVMGWKALGTSWDVISRDRAGYVARDGGQAYGGHDRPGED